nr:DUF397 domain-containing protein [Spirillospora albida]
MVERSNLRVAPRWRKSSASDVDGDCVEVAGDGRSVLVRDSRDPDGGLLALSSAQWRLMLGAIRNGDLDGR